MSDEWNPGFVGPAIRPGARPGCALVAPGLVVGEYPTAEDAAWLRDTHGVTAVVCLQDDGDLASKGLRLARLEAAYRRTGVRFCRVPIPDGDSAAVTARLDELVALVDDVIAGGGCVYLHCNAGFNRAPTVAIAWLHARRGMSLDEARDLVKKVRPCVPYMRVLETHFNRGG
jgi:atypical dual specificity phosphatase